MAVIDELVVGPPQPCSPRQYVATLPDDCALCSLRVVIARTQVASEAFVDGDQYRVLTQRWQWIYDGHRFNVRAR